MFQATTDLRSYSLSTNAYFQLVGLPKYGSFPPTFWCFQNLCLTKAIQESLCRVKREGREKGIYGGGHKPYPHANVMTALRWTIKQAKCQYRIKIESHYTGSDACRIWQGLQTITDYKGKHSRELPSDMSLQDELNLLLCSLRGK